MMPKKISSNFPDCSSDPMFAKMFRENDLVEALVQSLQRAKDEGRIRFGLESSLHMLEKSPKRIAMCVVPIKDNKDSLSHMMMMLIEAYCSENDVRMLKLMSPQEAWDLIDLKYYDEDGELDGPIQEEDFDDSLLLIEASPSGNHQDDELHKFYDMAASHLKARPIVRLRS